MYAANLNYFRLDENNSTLSVGYLLPNTQPSSIKDRYQGNGNFGIAQISVPSGTNAVDVFDVIRSPNNGSGLYSAVHVQCFITALIGNVGDAEIVGDFIVEFQGTSTTTVRQVNNITYGPGASYMSLVLASYSTDRARATLTITSSPSTNTFNTYVDIDGISYQFSPVTGS